MCPPAPHKNTSLVEGFSGRLMSPTPPAGPVPGHHIPWRPETATDMSWSHVLVLRAATRMGHPRWLRRWPRATIAAPVWCPSWSRKMGQPSLSTRQGLWGRPKGHPSERAGYLQSVWDTEAAQLEQRALILAAGSSLPWLPAPAPLRVPAEVPRPPLCSPFLSALPLEQNPMRRFLSSSQQPPPPPLAPSCLPACAFHAGRQRQPGPGERRGLAFCQGIN